jgi:hypothetical protein
MILLIDSSPSQVSVRHDPDQLQQASVESQFDLQHFGHSAPDHHRLLTLGRAPIQERLHDPLERIVASSTLYDQSLAEQSIVERKQLLGDLDESHEAY